MKSETSETSEYMSLDAFVEYLMDEERETFTAEDLSCLSEGTGRHNSLLRRDLEAWGLTLARRGHVTKVRGFTTSSNDRWYGPGSSPCHGGSGYEQINGFAGRAG